MERAEYATIVTMVLNKLYRRKISGDVCAINIKYVHKNIYPNDKTNSKIKDEKWILNRRLIRWNFVYKVF